MSVESTPVDRERLADLLGEDLRGFAHLIPEAMAQELLRGDRGYIAPFQLSAALLSRLRPEMRDWSTPDVLRTLAPTSPLAKNRMQAIAGALAPLTCGASPSFCYYPYVPFGHVAEERSEAPLIIAVHGSSRNPKDLREAYATFAERHGCFVLAPLFPLDLEASVPDEEYKQLAGTSVRYDQVVWAMVEELERVTATRFSKILLFGFSGGAQFAQRLLYADPGRLDAVSLGAPSYVTLPDPDRPWWIGLADFELSFGKPADIDAIGRLAIQLLCGSEDILPCDIYSLDELGMDAGAYAAYGRTRQQRLQTLSTAFIAGGIASQLTTVEGAGHAFAPLLEASKPFFEAVLHGHTPLQDTASIAACWR